MRPKYVLKREGSNIWRAKIGAFRISVTQDGDGWKANVVGRHYFTDSGTFTGQTIHEVAAKARAFIEGTMRSERG
jgi:hypothetical protein